MTASPELPAAGPMETDPGAIDPGASRRKVIVDLSLAVGLPVAGYYGAKALGASDYLALLTGTVLAGGRLLLLAVRARRVDAFSAFMLIIYGVGLAASVITGDPRLMLAKDSLGDGLPGIVFLVSAAIGRPFLYYAIQGFAGDSPARLARLREMWATNTEFRRAMTRMSVVWGAVMLGFSLARLPLVYLLPITVMAGASSIAYYVMLVGLTIWSFRYGRRRALAGQVS